MARRDGYSRGLESLEEIRASDRFIEQLRVSGTYEPSTRADAALAAALLSWRDEARLDPLNPPPSADEVDLDGYAQPRRIARRAVAVAAAMLALSSAAATALDGDPLKPVRFLVDLGVNVGERIADPSSSESSSGESPAEVLPDGEGFVPPWVTATQPDPDTPPSVDRKASTAPVGPDDSPVPGNPGTPEPTDAAPSITSTEAPPAADEGETSPPPDTGETSPPPDTGETSPPPDDGQTSPPPDDGQTSPPPDDGQTSPPPDDGQTSPPLDDGGANQDGGGPDTTSGGDGETQVPSAGDSVPPAGLEDPGTSPSGLGDQTSRSYQDGGDDNSQLNQNSAGDRTEQQGSDDDGDSYYDWSPGDGQPPWAHGNSEDTGQFHGLGSVWTYWLSLRWQ